MIKLFKWVYELGYTHAREQMFIKLERERDYQMTQSRIKGAEAKDTKHPEYGMKPKVTHEQHDQRYREVENILNQLDPERYPNLDRYFEDYFNE